MAFQHSPFNVDYCIDVIKMFEKPNKLQTCESNELFVLFFLNSNLYYYLLFFVKLAYLNACISLCFKSNYITSKKERINFFIIV